MGVRVASLLTMVRWVLLLPRGGAGPRIGRCPACRTSVRLDDAVTFSYRGLIVHRECARYRRDARRSRR